MSAGPSSAAVAETRTRADRVKRAATAAGVESESAFPAVAAAAAGVGRAAADCRSDLLDPAALPEKRARSVLLALARSAQPLDEDPFTDADVGGGGGVSGPAASPWRRCRSGFCGALHSVSHRRTFGVAFFTGAALAALVVGLAVRAALPGPAAPRFERIVEPFWPAELPVESAASWSYAPARPNGPPRWGVMADPATGAAFYPDCAADRAGQSPVDLPAMPSAAALPLVELAFSYPADFYSVQKRPEGHPGFQLAPCEPASAGGNCSGGGLALLSNASVGFPLAQFHFHRPSEHTVNGVSLAFEMHLVHLDAGTSAVAEMLSILFPAAESHNALFDSFWHELNHASVVGRVGLEQLLADTQPGTWSYTGSLTTPPCSGGVRWTVRLSNTGVNALQILVFEYALGGLENRRATQPLAGRTVNMSVWRR